MAASHPYEEPELTTILILSSFLLLLNAVYKVLDNMLYCGLVGQVFVGVLFGTPGVKLFNDTVGITISNLGYLGLILLVYEGGLSTSLSDLIASSTISLLVACSGIILPIALSFLLLPLGATPLQCFSSGAALSATSLGTAFTTLSSGGLLRTDVGTILTTAAMLDDVIGLIILQVVTEISTGQNTSAQYGKVIGRALGASFGLVLAVIIVCRFVFRPLYMPVSSWIRSPTHTRMIISMLEGQGLNFVAHTCVLISLVTAGSYAGTSNLFSAFIAGVVVRWWDDIVVKQQNAGQAPTNEQTELQSVACTGLDVFKHCYDTTTQQILKPLFFASIGFSIPLTQMFHRVTVWKGIIYALLMFLGKAATGLWLVPKALEPTIWPRIKSSLGWCRRRSKSTKVSPLPEVTQAGEPETTRQANDLPAATTEVDDKLAGYTPSSAPSELATNTSSLTQTENKAPPQFTSTIPTTTPLNANTASERHALCAASSAPSKSAENAITNTSSLPQEPPQPTLHTPVTAPDPDITPEKRALHAYAPALLGLAMTARGEIGFLIASIAASHGIFATPSASDSAVRPSPASSSGESDELYLIVVWAIVLCTIAGPVGVGGLVRRIKRLEAEAQGHD